MFTEQEHPEWGTLISSVELKDGSTMYAYRNGNMMYFIVNDEIEKSFHAENVGEIMEALLGIESGSAF